MTAVQLPLNNQPGKTAVTLNGRDYVLRTDYADTLEGGWFMDINDAQGTPMVCGIPLVTGTDLLGQYRYLGIGGRMFVTTQDPAASGPGLTDLGVSSFVWFEPS